MHIPRLKRVKVASAQALRTWLGRNAGLPDEVMIVTCTGASRDKHVSSAEVRRILDENGWSAGRSYTLAGNLRGHVARHR